MATTVDEVLLTPAAEHDVPTGRTWLLRDSWTEALRHLRGMRRSPELLMYATIQPIMFVVLFVYVFGGAINAPGYSDYKQYLLPGIFAQTVLFNSTFTSVGLADDLTKGIEEPGTEAGVVGAEHLAGRHGVGGDAPVAGRGVVHGVVEARRRNAAVVGGQRLADGIAVVVVCAGGGEHRGQLPGIELPGRDGLLRHRQRDLDRDAGAAAFGRRQRLRRGHREGARFVGGGTREDGPRCSPVVESRTDQADAVEVRGELHCARPRIRLQLVPPKPKELLSTRRGARCWFAVRY